MTKPNKPRSLYITVPENVHRAAKAIAALEGRQLGDVVGDAISAYVADRFPQLGNLGSPRSSGNPKNLKNSKEPNPSRRPLATTGPGSVGYVAPPSLTEDEEPLSDPLPLARDDEDPFSDMAEDVEGN